MSGVNIDTLDAVEFKIKSLLENGYSLLSQPAELQGALSSISREYGLVMAVSFGAKGTLGTSYLGADFGYDTVNGFALGAQLGAPTVISTGVTGTNGVRVSLNFSEGSISAYEYHALDIGPVNLDLYRPQNQLFGNDNPEVIYFSANIGSKSGAIPAGGVSVGATFAFMNPETFFVERFNGEMSNLLEGSVSEGKFELSPSEGIGHISQTKLDGYVVELQDKFLSAFSSGRIFDAKLEAAYLFARDVMGPNPKLQIQTSNGFSISPDVDTGDFVFSRTRQAGSELHQVYYRLSADGEMQAYGEFTQLTGAGIVWNADGVSKGYFVDVETGERIEANNHDEASVLLNRLQKYENYCFLGDTNILLSNGKVKPIKRVAIGDQVSTFEGASGVKLSGVVTQTYINQVDQILNFHGVQVTPGHAYFCGDGAHQGQFLKLIDIICADGAVVDADGQLIRAATNFPVGSREDSFVEIACLRDKSETTLRSGRLRAGTRLLKDDGSDVTVLSCLEQAGYQLLDNGLVQKDGQDPEPLHWFGEPPKPEDYILKRSNLLAADVNVAVH